jgi:hypothetical protein
VVKEEVVEAGKWACCREFGSLDRCGAGASLAEERRFGRRMAAMVLEGASADWGIGRRRKAAMAQGGT